MRCFLHESPFKNPRCQRSWDGAGFPAPPERCGGPVRFHLRGGSEFRLAPRFWLCQNTCTPLTRRGGFAALSCPGSRGGRVLLQAPFKNPRCQRSWDGAGFPAPPERCGGPVRFHLRGGSEFRLAPRFWLCQNTCTPLTRRGGFAALSCPGSRGGRVLLQASFKNPRCQRSWDGAGFPAPPERCGGPVRFHLRGGSEFRLAPRFWLCQNTCTPLTRRGGFAALSCPGSRGGRVLLQASFKNPRCQRSWDGAGRRGCWRRP